MSMNMFKLKIFASSLIFFSLSACEIVELDENNKPIITMSEEEKASLIHMSPEAIADKFWDDIIKEAEEKSVDTAHIKGDEQKSLFVKFSGNIEDVILSGKIITVKVNDGGKILDLQFGSIIRGNSIRDGASFISLDSFKDQVQFAQLSKALNKKAIAGVEIPDESWKGTNLSGIIAATVKDGEFTHIVPLKINRGQ